MILDTFFTSTGQLKRLKKTTSNGRIKEDYTNIVYTTLKACIQPVSNELVMLGEGDFYNTHKIYFRKDTDIQVGDKYVVGTKEYTIRGLRDRTYGVEIKLWETDAISK
jgi:hypothetical protein